jgi:hypothetical protein
MNQDKIEAWRHFGIAARVGFDDSMKNVQRGVELGFVEKKDLDEIRCAYNEASDEMKSELRNKASFPIGIA